MKVDSNQLCQKSENFFQIIRSFEKTFLSSNDYFALGIERIVTDNQDDTHRQNCIVENILAVVRFVLDYVTNYMLTRQSLKWVHLTTDGVEEDDILVILYLLPMLIDARCGLIKKHRNCMHSDTSLLTTRRFVETTKFSKIEMVLHRGKCLCPWAKISKNIPVRPHCLDQGLPRKISLTLSTSDTILKLVGALVLGYKVGIAG